MMNSSRSKKGKIKVSPASLSADMSNFTPATGDLVRC